MNVFVHPERLVEPLLAAAVRRDTKGPAVRSARVDGTWLRDARGASILALGAPSVATGLLVDVPEGVSSALDLLWGAPEVHRTDVSVVAALRCELAVAWCLPSVRVARMHGYRTPRT